MKEELVISLIIPIYNSEKYIPSLLDSIDNQRLDPKFYEVLFIDNGSNDRTPVLLKNYIKSKENAQYHFYNTKASSYAARNYGVKKSNGNILVFTDSDCILEENFLCNIHNYYSDEKYNKIIAGNINIVVTDKQNPWELFDKYSFLDNKRLSESNGMATANASVRKEIFERIGNFEEVASGGDCEWAHRAVQAGYKLDYKEDVLIYHPSRKSKTEIKNKMLRIAFGDGEKKKLANKSLTIWSILYCFKAGNVMTLARVYKNVKSLGLFKAFNFLLQFTGIRVKQIRAFILGYKRVNY